MIFRGEFSIPKPECNGPHEKVKTLFSKKTKKFQSVLSAPEIAKKRPGILKNGFPADGEKNPGRADDAEPGRVLNQGNRFFTVSPSAAEGIFSAGTAGLLHSVFTWPFVGKLRLASQQVLPIMIAQFAPVAFFGELRLACE